MILGTHGSMGDILIVSGIPQLYYEMYGEKTKIANIYAKEFWVNNPYVVDEWDGEVKKVRANSSLEDYLQYYPQRVFYEITGERVHRSKVQPTIYTPRKTNNKLILINDQAGWPSRRGYRYFNELTRKLMDKGYYIGYIRNENFRDCLNRLPPRQIGNFNEVLINLPMSALIDKMSEAAFYIGYESGISTLAGSLKVPYITLYGSIPAINTAHDTCIYYVDECDHCFSDQCRFKKNCLTTYKDYSDEILERIENYGN